MINQNELTRSIRFALIAGFALVASSAFAQTDAEKAEESAENLDEIVVTGTRIKSQTITSSSPVVEIGAEAVKISGATRIDDLVNQYPQLSPAFDSFQNNPSTGYPTVDLRGLGPQRTLTLVNGNRLATGAQEVADISIIPAALVSRVEILTGGASAVYGSDAVAGVVNFILDTEFEGVSVNVGYNGYQHKNDNEYIQGRLAARNFNVPKGSSGIDGVSKNVDIAIGSSFAEGAGHAMAWLTWRDNESLFQGERDYSSCALNAAGTACGGSATNAAGNFYFYQPATGRGSSASLNANGTFNNAYGAPYNYAPINYFQRPDERYTFGSSIKYEINENFKPYLETMFTNRQDSTQIAESGAFFTLLSGLNCSNPLIGTACRDLGLNAANPVNVYVAKRNVEGGPRLRIDESNTFRVVGGVEGALTDNWSYNTSFLYGRVRDDSQGFNDFLTPRIQQALLGCPAGSFAGCLPYNVFRPNGVTAAAANALAGISLFETATALTQFNAYVTGDLGFGFSSAGGDNVGLAVGVESRRSEYDFAADTDSQAGNFAGSGGPSIPVGGEIRVKELFLESKIPVLKDVAFFDSLDFDLGYRLSDYDRSGHADSYKFGFSAQISDYRVRGGYNRAIRAPGINNLFATNQIALFTGIDPCAGATPTFTAAECALQGVTAARYGNIAANPAGQLNQQIGGNLTLEPETADTWTFGFVAEPIDDLQLTADYYLIELQDTIATIGAPTILQACRTGSLCNLIRRGPGGDLFRGNDVNTSGLVRNLTNNFGEQTYSGIDLGATYGWEALGGRFATSLQGSYLLKKEINPLAGLPGEAAATYDCEGTISIQCQDPNWRHIANVNYARDLYSVNVRWRYYGSVDYSFQGRPVTTDTLVAPRGGIGSYNYFDLSGSYYIGEFGELSVGVNNIADKEPPLTGNTLALNGNAPGGYDQVGRYFFTSFSVKF